VLLRTRVAFSLLSVGALRSSRTALMVGPLCEGENRAAPASRREAFAALTEVIKNSRAQNGRFFGNVQGSGEPIAALADLLGSILNQNITAWRSSPAGVTIERTVVRWLLEPSDTFCRLFTLAFATRSFPDGERKPSLIGIDCLMCRHAKFRPLASHGTP
jgi:hypothetical protein